MTTHIAPPRSVQLTEEGFNEIVTELANIKEQKLPTAIQRVATARSFGDLSENAEYHAAREDLSFIEGKIAELEQIISHAKVLKTSTKVKSVVEIGVTVTLKSNKTQQTYHIVGEWEADPIKMKISHQSPLGKALLGKKAGDEVELDAPAGKVKYKVVELE